jgi:hypothetical protein
MDTDDHDTPAPDSLAYEAWVVIANAPGWDTDTEWRQAAIRWRDRFHATLQQTAELQQSARIVRHNGGCDPVRGCVLDLAGNDCSCPCHST